MHLPFLSKRSRHPAAPECRQLWLDTLRLDPALFQALSVADEVCLIGLAERFIDTRRITGAGDLQVTPEMVRRVALQACLPILHLGLDCYAAVRTVILYPGGFLVDRHWMDDAGVEHNERAALSGEAWQHGPVVLAWDAIDRPDPGSCLVIHEFMHVLDALNGHVNGFPPVADTDLAARWPDIFGSAYEDHCARADQGQALWLDAYAAEAPEEFLAVASELFFTDPVTLRGGYPLVHAALAGFFRLPVDTDVPV